MSLSSWIIRLITPFQSPGAFCRNNRMVLYQGVSFLPSIQRQSGVKGSKSHTGLAMAPARWATAVSTVMTRSRLCITAAVSAKSCNWALKSINRRLLKCFFICLEADPFCKLYKTIPSIWLRGIKLTRGQERLKSFSWVGLPAQTIPTLNPVESSLSCHMLIASRFALR